MSLIGIVKAARGLTPKTPGSADRAKCRLSVDTICGHVNPQTALTELTGQLQPLGGRHRQLALLPLAPQVGHQLARTHTSSVTRLQPQSLPYRLRRRLRAERAAEIVGGLVCLDGLYDRSLDDVRLFLVAEVLE